MAKFGTGQVSSVTHTYLRGEIAFVYLLTYLTVHIMFHLVMLPVVVALLVPNFENYPTRQPLGEVLATNWLNNMHFGYFYLSESAKKLHCFQCYSKISLADCDKSSKKAACSNEEDDVCLILTAHTWETTNGTQTGRVVSHYAKYCASAKDCSEKQCKEIGWNCQIDCCNQDMCNASNAIWLNKILFVAVQGLAVHKILTTYWIENS